VISRRCYKNTFYPTLPTNELQIGDFLVFHEKRYEMIFHFKTPDFMTTCVSPIRFYFELGFRDSDDISQKAYMAYHRLDTYYRNLLPATTG
jgi:hypothetical protein